MATMPEPAIAERVASLLGWRPQRWRPVSGGYTPTARYAVSDGTRSAFVKIATTPITVEMLHREIAAYDAVHGPFMPRLLGADDDAAIPILAIEDLSHATWPPPWTTQLVDSVVEAIATMQATPTTLRRGTLLDGREPGWPTVAKAPGPFLSLGLVSPRWLDAALPQLIAAEQSCPLAGDELTHFDLRSDNLCIAAGGVKFIDWAEARRSSGRVDLGFFLPSLAYEGGPAPEAILPDAPDVAALVSGFFALRAGMPDIVDAPYVRRVQREQLAAALPWAIRALDLPEPR
jgi:hypothetical protein